MRKIILCALFIFLLTGCKAVFTINHSLYIASIGFAKEEEEYLGYFYLPSLQNVGMVQSDSETEIPAKIAKIKGDNILDVFNTFEISTSLEMNLKHISSIVFHKSILNEGDIEQFINYVKNSKDFDFNFYIFVTENPIEEIYKTKTPNKENVILTKICEPKSSLFTYISAEPIHFLSFCREFYNEKVIPLVNIEPTNVWGKNIDSTYCRGIAFFDKGSSYFFKQSDVDFSWLKSKKKMEYNTEEYGIILKKYKCKIKYKKEIEIIIQSKISILYQKIEDIKSTLEEEIKEKIRDLISNYEESIDFLNLKYYDSIGKNIKIKVDLKIEK